MENGYCMPNFLYYHIKILEEGEQNVSAISEMFALQNSLWVGANTSRALLVVYLDNMF